MYYFTGLIEQVDYLSNGLPEMLNVEEYLSMRRRTIGAMPALALLEHIKGVKLPGDVFLHSSIQECITIMADLVLL